MKNQLKLPEPGKNTLFVNMQFEFNFRFITAGLVVREKEEIKISSIANFKGVTSLKR